MKKKNLLGANNVIPFPVQRIVNPITTALHSSEPPSEISKIKDAYYIMKVNKISAIMEVLIPLIAQGLAAHGIGLNRPTETKNMAFVIESIRSMLFHVYGIDHSLQKLVDTLLTIENGEVHFNDLYIKGANNA